MEEILNLIIKELNIFKDEMKQKRKELEKEYEDYKKANHAYCHPLYRWKDPRKYLETIELIDEAIRDAHMYFSEDGIVLPTYYVCGVSGTLIEIAEKNNLYVYMPTSYLKWFINFYTTTHYMEIVDNNATITMLDKNTNQFIEKDGFTKLKIKGS